MSRFISYRNGGRWERFNERFLSYEIDDRRGNFPRCDRKSRSETFHETSIRDLPPIRSHDFSRWETLTSDIKGYKNSRDALRPLSGKEIGTTVFTLNGVDAELRRQNRKLYATSEQSHFHLMIYYINLMVYKINYAGQFDPRIYIYLQISYKSKINEAC